MEYLVVLYMIEQLNSYQKSSRRQHTLWGYHNFQGHPQTNRLVEHFNRTLKQMLSKLVNNKGCNWDKILGGVLFAYRSTPHQSTGETPFYLLYGRKQNLPTALDLAVPSPWFPVVESDYGLALKKELKEIWSVAKKNVEATQRRQKTYYDKGSRDSVLKEDGFVMLKVLR